MMGIFPSPLLRWSLWVASIVFLYPIPGTVALRNGILLAGLIAYGISLWRTRYAASGSLALGNFRLPALLLLLLTVWMLLQMLLVAWYPAQSWAMWKGDWLVTWLTALFAFLLCRHLAHTQAQAPHYLLTAALWGLMLHIFILLAYQAFLFYKIGADALGQTPFAQRDYHSTLSVTVSALILAELFARMRTHARPSLLCSTPVLSGLFLINLIATITLRTRNGSVIIFALLAIAAIACLFTSKCNRRKLAATLMLTLAGLTAVAWLLVKSDARWERLIATAQVSTQIDSNLHWLSLELGQGLPLLPDGIAVEESAYDRLAWATAATRQIETHPLGVGYGHKAFGWAVNRAYAVNTGHESSHSGILDFTLANGIPGLVLWLAFSLSLIYAGCRLWQAEHNIAGLMVAAHVLAYDLRTLLDGHFSGFRLKLFALILALLIAACVFERQAKNNHASTPA